MSLNSIGHEENILLNERFICVDFEYNGGGYESLLALPN